MLTYTIQSTPVQLLLGESGLGKTTFINTLFTTTIKAPKNHKRRFNKTTEKTVEIEIIRAGMLYLPVTNVGKCPCQTIINLAKKTRWHSKKAQLHQSKATRNRRRHRI